MDGGELVVELRHRIPDLPTVVSGALDSQEARSVIYTSKIRTGRLIDRTSRRCGGELTQLVDVVEEAKHVA